VTVLSFGFVELLDSCDQQSVAAGAFVVRVGCGGCPLLGSVFNQLEDFVNVLDRNLGSIRKPQSFFGVLIDFELVFGRG
jgi:hypothetical protein